MEIDLTAESTLVEIPVSHSMYSTMIYPFNEIKSFTKIFEWCQLCQRLQVIIYT